MMLKILASNIYTLSLTIAMIFIFDIKKISTLIFYLNLKKTYEWNFENSISFITKFIIISESLGNRHIIKV